MKEKLLSPVKIKGKIGKVAVFFVSIGLVLSMAPNITPLDFFIGTLGATLFIIGAFMLVINTLIN